MTKKDAIAHFGNQYKLAAALGIKQPSVARWSDRPPPLRQIQMQQLTVGILKADQDVFERVHG